MVPQLPDDENRSTIRRVRPLVSRRALLAGLAALAACRRAARAGRERPLVFAFGPLHAPRDARALERRLASASKLDLELRVVASSNAAIDLVQLGRADAALLPLFDFLFCADLFGAQPLVQLVREGGRDTQASEIVVQDGAPARDLDALRGQRVGYVDRYSVTGFILPAARLREAGVEVTPVWLDTHDAVLAAVREGRVAAGATFLGHAKTEPGLRVLATTGSIANEPVFVQSALPEEARAALRDALIAERDATALAGVADAIGFRAPPPGTYDAALVTLKAAGQRVEDMVPGGWSRANDHRRPLWSYAP